MRTGVKVDGNEEITLTKGWEVRNEGLNHAIRAYGSDKHPQDLVEAAEVFTDFLVNGTILTRSSSTR